ncbi:MAG: hypothetical protein AB1502_06935 [Thermodesulfobacteriota bacterium]
MKSTLFKTSAVSGGVIHGVVKSGEILAQRPTVWRGVPKGQNLGALVALCG